MEFWKSVHSSFSSSFTSAWIQSMISSMPMQASTAPANLASSISLYFAMHGERKTTFASGYFSLIILPCAMNGETTGAMYSTRSPYSFSISVLMAGHAVEMIFFISPFSIRFAYAFETTAAPRAVSSICENPLPVSIFSKEDSFGQTAAKEGATERTTSCLSSSHFCTC